MDFQSIKNILKFISAIGIGLSIFFVIPILTGLIYSEPIKKYIIFDLLFFGTNFLIFSFLSKHHFKMNIKESIFAVNLIWILLGVSGGAALHITSNASFVDSFFEAISGFTTTGATMAA